MGEPEATIRFNVDTSLEGSYIAISGGGGGIGLATAKAFLQSGARVLLIDADKNRLQIARATLGTERLHYHCSSLHCPQACSDALLSAGAPVFALVHLAGTVERDFFDPARRDIWDRTLAVNLTSAYDMCVAFHRLADVSRGPSRIVLMSSMVYRRGGIGAAPYGAAKAGIAGLTRALSRQLAPAILVNALAPGVIETPMTVEMREQRGEEFLRDIPLKRFGQAHEVAAVVHFLCGRGATYITGQVINVDGGVVNS